MQRRSFLKIASSALAVIAAPSFAAQLLSIHVDRKGQQYFRFPSGLEFISSDPFIKRRRTLSFYASHIYDFDTQVWTKNRWPEQGVPRTDFSDLRNMMLPDLVDAGIFYRVLVEDEEMRRMSYYASHRERKSLFYARSANEVVFDVEWRSPSFEQALKRVKGRLA